MEFIKRVQDATNLIGRVFFNGRNVVEFTGNDPKTGFLEVNGSIDCWIGFAHLREDIQVVEITGLSTRGALRKIKGAFPSSCRFMREKHLKQILTKN